MAAKVKLKAIFDGNQASLAISTYSGSLIVHSIEGLDEVRDEIDISGLDSINTQKVLSRMATWEDITFECQNEGDNRSAISALTGILTFTLDSPNALDDTTNYTITFEGEIKNMGGHSFSNKENSTFTMVVMPTCIDALGVEDVPTYS